jgi:hypothetical protein
VSRGAKLSWEFHCVRKEVIFDINAGRSALERNFYLKVRGLHSGEILMLPLVGMHVKHAVQRGILLNSIYKFSSYLKETHSVCATKISQLILFREMIAAYCGEKNHTRKHSGENSGFPYVTAASTYSNYRALKG